MSAARSGRKSKETTMSKGAENKGSEKMVAYCGLVCTECPAFLATKKDDLALAMKTAAEWSKAFGVDVKVEHVWCDGCLVGGKKCAHCGECEIRACAEERGLSSCAACADYACAQLEAFFAMAPTARVELEALRAK
jgi:hypothetical protein